MPLKGTTIVSPRFHTAEGEIKRLFKESIGLPEVLFLVPAQNFPFVVNEISDIVQLMLPGLSILKCFHYRPRHHAYFELFCQLLISVQIIIPLPAEGEELGVFGHPIREVIFGEDRELGTL